MGPNPFEPASYTTDSINPTYISDIVENVPVLHARELVQFPTGLSISLNFHPDSDVSLFYLHFFLRRLFSTFNATVYTTT